MKLIFFILLQLARYVKYIIKYILSNRHLKAVKDIIFRSEEEKTNQKILKLNILYQYKKRIYFFSNFKHTRCLYPKCSHPSKSNTLKIIYVIT